MAAGPLGLIGDRTDAPTSAGHEPTPFGMTCEVGVFALQGLGKHNSEANFYIEVPRRHFAPVTVALTTGP